MPEHQSLGIYQQSVPGWARKILHWSYWNLLPRWLRGEEVLTRLAVRRTANRVVAGPFAGMQYVCASYGSVLVPKLLGIYEKELHPAIEEIISQSPSTIINLGTAEGYYAVGLAARLPNCRVIGYDMSEQARVLTLDLAAGNSVAGQIELHGECTAQVLGTLAPAPPCVVLCDIEGGEDSVLDLGFAPWLAQATLLIELHDFLLPGIGVKLEERFAGTHSIQIIQQTARNVDEFPFHSLFTSWLPDLFRTRVISEWRPAPQSWLYARPKNRA